MLLDSDFEFISSQDGWSLARVRAADAEYREYRRATRQAMLEETAARVKDYEGSEPGATTQDLRVYTEVEGGYRYWGVRVLKETIEEFWARNDPDNIRQRIAKQDSGPLPAPAKLIPAESPLLRSHMASRSKRRQETPKVARRRVTIPAMVTPASRKSVASNIEGTYSQIYEQTQDLANSTTKESTVVPYPWGKGSPDGTERLQTISGVNSRTFDTSATKIATRGRPRKIQPGFVDSYSSNSPNWPSSTRDHPPKRKRGRPAKEKYPTKSSKSHRSYASNEKQKRPASESKAKVTKSKSKNDRPIAPSVHTMRTRAKGPVENLPGF